MSQSSMADAIEAYKQAGKAAGWLRRMHESLRELPSCCTCCRSSVATRCELENLSNASRPLPTEMLMLRKLKQKDKQKYEDYLQELCGRQFPFKMAHAAGCCHAPAAVAVRASVSVAETGAVAVQLQLQSVEGGKPPPPQAAASVQQQSSVPRVRLRFSEPETPASAHTQGNHAAKHALRRRVGFLPQSSQAAWELADHLAEKKSEERRGREAAEQKLAETRQELEEARIRGAAVQASLEKDDGDECEKVSEVDRLKAAAEEAERKRALAAQREASMRNRLVKENSTNLTRRVEARDRELDEVKRKLAEAQRQLREANLRIECNETTLEQVEERRTQLQAVRTSLANKRLVEQSRCAVKTARVRELSKEVRQLKSELEARASKWAKQLASRDEELAALREYQAKQASAHAAFSVGMEERLARERLRAQVSDWHSLELEKQLAADAAALQAMRSFQAMEGGRFKDVVRTCYYKLLNRKIPSNQIEGVVRDVLEMIGVQAKKLPKRAAAARMRYEMGHVADVTGGVALAKAERVVGASDDTTKLQEKQGTNNAHFVDRNLDHSGRNTMIGHAQRRTVNIGIGQHARGTADAKVEGYAADLRRVRTAAATAVPNFYGDVTAYDSIDCTLLSGWSCDRAAVETCAGAKMAEMKRADACVREGRRRLALLRGDMVAVSCSMQQGGYVSLKLEVGRSGARLAELELAAEAQARKELGHAVMQGELVGATCSVLRGGAVQLRLHALSAKSLLAWIEAHVIRQLGEAWWASLTVKQQERETCIRVATCCLHRTTNTAGGAKAGILSEYHKIREEQAMPASADAAPAGAAWWAGGAGAAAANPAVADPSTSKAAAPAVADQTSKAIKADPIGRAIYETAKLVCPNARKMNVAVGKDISGFQMVELDVPESELLHTKMKVMVGERNLVESHNARVWVALESELTPAPRRLSRYLQTRKDRKNNESLNRLEQSVLVSYSDRVLFDAERALALIGEGLLLPMYNATYQVEHILEMNKYYQWLDALIARLIENPGPLLQGSVHALSYFNSPRQRDDMMRYVLHTPSWGDVNFLRLLKAGLREMKVLLIRHTHEHLVGGELDYERMSGELANTVWQELEAHPLENNDCERDLALICFLGVSAPVMRLEAKAGVARFGRNVGRAGQQLVTDSWSAEHVRSTYAYAISQARERRETAVQELARLHRERLPEERAKEARSQARVAKRKALRLNLQALRDSGLEVRSVGACQLLTVKQLQVQLAIRAVLDKVAVKRSGKRPELLAALQEIVLSERHARNEADGGGETDTEMGRLRGLGLGRMGRAGGIGARNRRSTGGRTRNSGAAAELSENSGSDESSDDEDSGYDEVGLADVMDEEDEDVYEVEKIEKERKHKGKVQYYVRWKGYPPNENSWEPAASILDPELIADFKRRMGKAPARGNGKRPAAQASAATRPDKVARSDGGSGATAAVVPAAPPPLPTRQQPSRRAASAAVAAAHRNQEAEERSDDDLSSESDDEQQASTATAHAPASAQPGRRQQRRQATSNRNNNGGGRGKRKRTVQMDSSDEEGAHKPSHAC